MFLLVAQDIILSGSSVTVLPLLGSPGLHFMV